MRFCCKSLVRQSLLHQAVGFCDDVRSAVGGECLLLHAVQKKRVGLDHLCQRRCQIRAGDGGNKFADGHFKKAVCRRRRLDLVCHAKLLCKLLGLKARRRGNRGKILSRQVNGRDGTIGCSLVHEALELAAIASDKLGFGRGSNSSLNAVDRAF